VLSAPMALNVPLICSDIPENLYLVKDTAVTFERSNIESLQRSIEFALKKPERMQELAEQAKERARSNFTWDRVVSQHLDVFGN